jgi:ABC-type oligopeptide transport system ATPase subunit
MSDIILQLSKVCKSFKGNDGNLVWAMKDVSMFLNKGEWLGIVGESGCGKSTLARIVSRLDEPTSGQVLFRNRDIGHLKGSDKYDYYRKVQMVFQNPLSTFSPRMTIGTYLMEPFINFGLMNKNEARAFAESLLLDVGLTKDMMKRYPNELSGGQLQRVVIARTIGLEPDLLICDECTSALDVSIQKEIVQLLLSLKKKKMFSVIFITHDLALGEGLCNRIYVMKDGKIVESLGDDIIKEANHPYTKQLTKAVYSIHSLGQV